MWTTVVSKRNGGKIQQSYKDLRNDVQPIPVNKKLTNNSNVDNDKVKTKSRRNPYAPNPSGSTSKDTHTYTMEKIEWQKKYNPKMLRLGMVPPSAFVNVNDKELFKVVKKCIDLFENHIDERLPEDFRKYLLYCGPMFFNWSVYGISLNSWNEDDKDDNTRMCMWCKKPLENTKCICKMFNGEKTETAKVPGLVCFSHEGCGIFKYIVVKGPLKGTIWGVNTNYYPEYHGSILYKIDKSFKELLDSIYDKRNLIESFN